MECMKDSMKQNEYINRLVSKEKVHMRQFLKNEKSLYNPGTQLFDYLEDLMQKYEQNADTGKHFLNQEMNQLSQDEKAKRGLVFDMMQKYKYESKLVKQAFRMMEDDSKNNYILKLIRQSKCQLAGFNSVLL